AAAALLTTTFAASNSAGRSRPEHKAPHAIASTTSTTVTPPQPVWRVAWGSAMAWGYGTSADVTVRDLATVGVGGEAIRVRISNVFGNEPLVIGAATVGLEALDAAIVAGTLHPLTFGGAPSVTVPVGQFLYSDPVPMSVNDMQTLAISVYVRSTELVSVHPCCTKIASYFTPNGGGNLTDSLTGAGLSIASPWERWVDAVDVLRATTQGSIVVVGDSITEGFNSALRWTDVLQQRINMLPVSEQRAVVNEAITANALTSGVHTDDQTGGGPSGLSRLARDALNQSGVSEVILFLGTNDLWFGATAQQLITGFNQAIAAVHQAGRRIVGVTLLPRATDSVERWTALDQTELEQVDNWIVTSGSFDGVLNLAPTVADAFNGACSPDILFPPYDSNDHLHPNQAGQTAMADAIDSSVLQLPALPQVPPLVSVIPTANCNAAAVDTQAPASPPAK
ncbi:MAG TPA: GDSL-type esterase/lipase family protein, partial [Acidimicrobiales bacterium]|nr:GDSL-type esterase/lipase family protein [Acidimicrobiales bacterium]